MRELSVLFERVLVPSAVHEELRARADANSAVLRGIDDFAIFEKCKMLVN